MNQVAPHEGLHVAPAIREDARRRLLSIKGHVEGILRMLDDKSVYCVDILKQIRAIDGALDKVGDLVLRNHLRDHVVNAHERELTCPGRRFGKGVPDEERSHQTGTCSGRNTVEVIGVNAR